MGERGARLGPSLSLVPCCDPVGGYARFVGALLHSPGTGATAVLRRGD